MRNTNNRNTRVAQSPPCLAPNVVVTFVERYYWVFALLFLAIIAFFCFYQLGQLPARDWDEARHGVSAYEMLKNHNLIVNTYQYETDYWNLKPPVSFWGVMLGYRLFGFNLFGLRFYSAVAFLLCAAVIGFFTMKRYGRLESVAALLLMACNSPFYRFHFARHGDSDALFGLFSVISLLAMLLSEEHKWARYFCTCAFALAFLTKSWHALFIPVVVVVFLLCRKLPIRSFRQWILPIAVGALPILLWGVLRFQYDGIHFFQQMFQIDLFNRTTQVLENHTGPFNYYLILLFQLSLITGLLPLIVGPVYYITYADEQSASTSPQNENLRRDTLGYLLWFGLGLLLFSLSRTKLSWYLIPLNFPIVILSGLWLAQLIRHFRKRKDQHLWVIFAAVAVIIFFGFKRTWTEISPPFQEPLQSFLQEHRPLSTEQQGGEKAYLAVDMSWIQGGYQSSVLLGELFYDWSCQLGEADSFLSDPDATFLLIDDQRYTQAALELESCTILAQDYGYRLLYK